MAVAMKQVEVAKELDEVLAWALGIVKTVKLAKADGWQTGTDLPAVVLAAVAGAPAAFDGLDQLDDEWSAHKAAVLMSGALFASNLVAELTAPKAPSA